MIHLRRSRDNHYVNNILNHKYKNGHERAHEYLNTKSDRLTTTQMINLFNYLSHAKKRI